MNQVHLCDCMEFMKGVPDKYYELAIVDPPYGDVTNGGYMNNANTISGCAKHQKYNLALWSQSKPSEEYFIQLTRISKNQIIYWEAQEERYQTHISQGDLFTGFDLQESIMQGVL